MFPRPSQRLSKAVLWTAGAALLVLSGMPAMAQGEVICPEEASPYLFILFDTSASMNRAPACSAADFAAGLCSPLCNGDECYVPLQADSPDSKFVQIKAGLYSALSSPEAENVSFGFATFNQDALYARAKHWLYEATGNGVTIPGWGSFPAAGSRDVLGRVWACDEGSGDNEVGCLATNPADLSDAWELARVRTLAKGGATFTSSVTFYVRHAGAIYRIRYVPTGSWTPGLAVSFQIRRERCLNSTCTAVDPAVIATVGYTPVSEYLVWDNDAFRTEPIGYFGQSNAADTTASNTCSGWDPNTDSVADRYNGTYSLRWPTDASDPRGTPFTKGDVLPLDWIADHREDIQQRLAPNLVLDPLATPDFRTSPYLRDAVLGVESFLRLKDETVRPLIATGSTPHGGVLRSFRIWYAGCVGSCPPGNGWVHKAAAQDPDFYCRPRNVLLITDGPDTCGTPSPCADAAALYSQFGVRTFVVAYGVNPSAVASLSCIAQNGHTEMRFPRNPGDLGLALAEIFLEAGQQP